MSGLFKFPIDAKTHYCAVYGHPIEHSASPAMQNAGISALRLNWRYLAFDVHPDDLGEAIAGAKLMNFIGLNLTIPHKLLAFKMVDELDQSAKLWGAVNTIRFEGRTKSGEWRPLRQFEEAPRELRSHGFNTDADAITRSLKEDLGFQPRGARVLLLGAGGAGRTAALRLAACGVSKLFLVNRTLSKARVVANEIADGFPKTKVNLGYPKPSEVDLILNATSLGLKSSDPLPFDQTEFRLQRAHRVYDMIYRPAETPLLKLSKKIGCRNSNGLGMLLYQGAKALEIWTGRKAPLTIMRKALEKNVYG